MKLKILLVIATLTASQASNAEKNPSLGLEAKGSEITLKKSVKRDLYRYFDKHPYLIDPVETNKLKLDYKNQADEINKQINKERSK